MAELTVRAETWPIAGGFTISRGRKTEAEVVVVELTKNALTGRGECVPYPRYDESVASVVAQIESLRQPLAQGLRRHELARALPAGAARNAVDCALWDLDAKRAELPVWDLAGLDRPMPCPTAFTISLGAPEVMAEAAEKARDRPILKLKLGGEGDPERVAAVRQAVPGARLIADANEAWTAELFTPYAAELARLGVELIEQPLPAGADQCLESLAHPVPLCADESSHGRDTLAAISRRYEMINIKLDKTGGLTEAIKLARKARSLNLGVMVGCMVATSLAMAPAVLLAQFADFVDLDGPLLLTRDRAHGLVYDGGMVNPPQPPLWG